MAGPSPPHASAEESAIERARAMRDAALEAQRVLQDRLAQFQAQKARTAKSEYIRGMREMALLIGAAAAAAFVLRSGIRRYRVESDIPGKLIRRQATLHGYVMRVTDGDGVRFYHQPWLRRVLFPEVRQMRKITEDTINVRLAAVDAPECAHYGMKGQPFAKEAKEFLRELSEKKQASLTIHQLDQYKRVLGTVQVKSGNRVLRFFGLGKKNASAELAKNGLAEVYRGPNACYGRPGKKSFEAMEAAAKKKRLGMWSQKKVVTPTEYKARLRREANGGGAPSNMKGQSFLPAALLMSVARSAWGLVQPRLLPSSKKTKRRKRSGVFNWF